MPEQQGIVRYDSSTSDHALELNYSVSFNFRGQGLSLKTHRRPT